VRERILNAQARYPDRLKIFTGAFVTGVLIDSNPRRAIGVEYVEGAGVYEATPPKEPGSKPSQFRKLLLRKGGEVILAGGAFNTPQLLMLSGIGDSVQLKTKGIKCKCNLPGVGENLQDRYEMSLVTELADPTAQYSLLDKLSFKTPSGDCNAPPGSAVDEGFQQWCNHRGVYLTNGVLVSYILKSKQVKDGPPDLFIFGTPGNFRGYKKGWSTETQKDEKGENHRRFSWVVLKNGKTKGKGGYVRLNSKNPFERPVINFKYFDNDDEDGTMDWKKDRDALAEGIHFANDLMKSTGLPHKIVYPFVDGQVNGKTAEDALKTELGDFILKESWGHHACGTCKIGAKDDKMAVLDGDFRVRGVENLRVVDASVFPKIPGLFIVSSIYMISEKAADVILADANLKRSKDSNKKPKPWPKPAPGLE
jgi:choline dehydrogenase